MDVIEKAPNRLFECEPSTSQGPMIRRRDTAGGSSVDPHLGLGADLFPEFKTVLPGEDSVDEDSDGCPLPGTPEEESLMDPKV